MTFSTDPSDLLLSAVLLATLILKVWALADCAVRAAPAFPAAGKLTKVAWLAITGLSLLVALFVSASPIGLLGIAGLVAAIVYLVDVRPAVRTVSSGGSWR